MKCCVILHNMILEDERGLNLPCFYDNVGTRVQPERNPSRIHTLFFKHIVRLRMQPLMVGSGMI
uniref:Uncharacterized protein n=1 Tax=Aegilops tauschii subsp. strangulata TaxID=200361 RepID=A0A453DAG4_AEGTS